MTADEYTKQLTQNILNYRMGLVLAIQEIEESANEKLLYHLKMYRMGLDERNEKLRVIAEEHMLRATGRGYLIDVLPKLSDFLK